MSSVKRVMEHAKAEVIIRLLALRLLALAVEMDFENKIGGRLSAACGRLLAPTIAPKGMADICWGIASDLESWAEDVPDGPDRRFLCDATPGFHAAANLFESLATVLRENLKIKGITSVPSGVALFWPVPTTELLQFVENRAARL